jgi:hypothetical protein
MCVVYVIGQPQKEKTVSYHIHCYFKYIGQIPRGNSNGGSENSPRQAQGPGDVRHQVFLQQMVEKWLIHGW